MFRNYSYFQLVPEQTFFVDFAYTFDFVVVAITIRVSSLLFYLQVIFEDFVGLDGPRSGLVVIK